MKTMLSSLHLTLVASVICKELFKNSNEMTVSKEWYEREFTQKIIERCAPLIMDMKRLYKAGIPAEMILPAVFLKEKLDDIIKNKKCDLCPAKDICEDKHCETPTDGSVPDVEHMTNDQVNQFIENFLRDHDHGTTKD